MKKQFSLTFALIYAMLIGLTPLPAVAQTGDHELVENGVDKFAFDPPLLLYPEIKGDLLSQLRVREKFERTEGFGHLAIAGQFGIYTGLNNANPAYVDFEGFGLTSTDSPMTTFQAPIHELGDLNGDGMTDALIYERGSSSIYAAQGLDSADGLFAPFIGPLTSGDLLNSVEVVSDQSIAIALLEPTALRILEDKHFQQIFEDQNGDITGVKTDFDGIGEIVSGTHYQTYSVFVVVSSKDDAFFLSTFKYEDQQLILVDIKNIEISSFDEKPVALELIVDETEEMIQAVVLTSVLDQNQQDHWGRLRVIDIDVSLEINDTLATAEVIANFSQWLQECPHLVTDSISLDFPTTVFSMVDMRIRDLASTDRSGSDGVPDIVIVGNVKNEKCDVTRPAVQIWNLAKNNSGGSIADVISGNNADQSGFQLSILAETVISETAHMAFMEEPMVVDLEVARMNGDDLLDIALLDRSNGSVIVLRQQPQPCVTFITAITHGHQGFHSMSGNTFPVTYNDRYNRLLASKVARVNLDRRQSAASNPELCPIAHIGVNGHWEKLTEPGALSHMLGRIAWSAGALLPAPVCMVPVIPPLPAPEPPSYWLSLVWLTMPHLCPPFVSPEPATAVRFASAGLGFGIELYGRHNSSDASREASAQLANTIDDAISTARDAMDVCEGQIGLDLIGFSRGASVTNHSMRGIDESPVRYNADVSFLYLDAIDPSWVPASAPPWFTTLPNGDSVRPWAKSGFFVGDPIMESTGSAMVSSVHAPSPGTPFIEELDQIAIDFENLLTGYGGGSVNIPRDVVGIPSGYNREAALASSAGGWFAQAEPGTVHDGVRDDFFAEEPEDDFIDLPIPRSFANTSHIGAFLNDARVNQPNYPGWSASVQSLNETDFLPEECNENVDTDPPDSAASESQFFSVSSVPGHENQFIIDPEFNLMHGINANVKELHAIKDLPGDPANIAPVLKKNRFLNSFLESTIENNFPVGLGKVGWSSGESCLQCPLLISDMNESRIDQYSKRLANLLHSSPIEFSIDNIGELENRMKSLVIDEQAIDHDFIDWSQLALSGASRLDDAQLVFGNNEQKISQELLAGSLLHSQLLLRVFYKPLTAESELKITVKGPGLDQQIDAPVNNQTNDWQEIIVHLDREANQSEPQNYDSITLSGKDTSVTGVWVTPNEPIEIDGFYYEVVNPGNGLDWKAAEKMLEHRIYKGRQARMAEFGNADLNSDDLFKVMKTLDTKYPVWLGAKKSGENDLIWLNSSTVNGWSVDESIENTLEDNNYLFASPDGYVGIAGTRAAIDGDMMGVLVQY